MEQDEIIIHGPLLSHAIRHQTRKWIWLGPLLTVLLLLLALWLVPISYTAEVSVAMQQAPGLGGNSPLAMLAGGGGGQNKIYVGILKSRQMAKDVERHVHLQQLYGISEDKAVESLMTGIKTDDMAADGLLYITVTLPGPARISLRPSPDAAQVKAVAVQAADAYALALKEYYATRDTDQSSVLLRSAQTEQDKARANYDAALTQLLQFSRSLKRVDPRSLPSPSSLSDTSGTTDAASAASGLSALYTAQAQIQAQLSAIQASRRTLEAGTTNQIQHLSQLPTDDQLLEYARGKVTLDQATYNTVFRLYGPENPLVIRAQTQLQVDQAQLHRQVQGVKNNLTTPDLLINEQIHGLYARQAVVQKQIAQAERQLGVHRELSGEFGRLQTEVGIQLEVLKATLGEAAKIRLDNAYAQNRMSIIDWAIPPRNGSPPLWRLALICLIPSVLLFLRAVVRQYLREVKMVGDAPNAGASANGNGTGAKPALEGEDAVVKTGKH